MSRNRKIALGIITLWPLIYIPAFIILMFSCMAGSVWLARGAHDGPLSDPFASPVFVLPAIGVAVLHLLTAVAAAVVFLFYLYHMITNRDLTDQQKIAWALLLITTASFAMPVYFYIKIWKAPSAAVTFTSK